MKPKILITCGDPNSIGPEIILKIFSDHNFKKKYDLKVIGATEIFRHYSKSLKIRNLHESEIINLDVYRKFFVREGKIDRLSGRISGDAIKIGAHLVMNNKFDALVTMPVNKEALNAGGYPFNGHTNMLASLTGSKNPVMLMYSKEIKVVPLTIHVPLNQVSDILNPDILKRQILTVNKTMNEVFGIKKPGFALLSLNPHNGDGGLLGHEEKLILMPLINKLKNNRIKIDGTFAADSYFGNKTYKNFDVTFAIYHDQGLIPFKMIAGKKGVNYTGGIKIIRTSPVHGTGFDITGKGIADAESSKEAIKLAHELVLKQKAKL